MPSIGRTIGRRPQAGSDVERQKSSHLGLKLSLALYSVLGSKTSEPVRGEGMEENLEGPKVLICVCEAHVFGIPGSSITPSHCPSVLSHLPRGSSNGQDSRGSGCSSSNTEDSTGTSTLQSAGAGGGLPE